MDDKNPAGKPVGGDLILPLCGAIYALYYMWSVRDFPIEAQMSGMVLAGLLLMLVAIYLVRLLRGLPAGRFTLGIGTLLGPADTRPQRVAFFVLMLVAVAAIRWLGFTLTTFLFLTLSFLVLGIRPVRRGIIVAGLAALFGWFFFIYLLSTRFPQGPFEQLMQAIL